MLTDKRVIISGGASQLGSKLATSFLKQKAKVVLSDSNEESLVKIANEMALPFCITDIRNETDCIRLIEKSNRVMGGIDILINCANMQYVTPIEIFPLDTWKLMIDMLLTGPFLLTKYVWPLMRKQKWGRIIYLNSIHGLIASESKVAYVSAKHGLSGLTKAASVEGGKYNITVNSICPSFITSPGTEKQINDVAKELKITKQEAMENHLLGKAIIKTPIDIEEVVELFCFLCSENAKHITGSMITMDGGYTAN